MDVTQSDLARVPPGNLRVDLTEFGHLWAAAQAHQDSADCDPYTAGVLDTCRWLAGAMLRPAGASWLPAPAPLTPGRGRAMPELIETEYLAAGRLIDRAGFLGSAEAERIAGVLVTLGWAWARTGVRPTVGHVHHRPSGGPAKSTTSAATSEKWSDASHRAS